MQYGVLAIRDPVTGLMHDNLLTGGFLVRSYDKSTGKYFWTRMTSENTRILNPEHDPAKHRPDDPLYPKWLIPI